ncbi:MAG TPA: hypothetical protein VND19_00065 [Acetobacteraceae bacterium]|nr:hypothetical protein [Acetobacteraceae bacterium]
MRLRALLFAALGGAFLLTAVAPAFADRNDWRHGDRRHHEDHEWHGHPDWDRGYYAPPVVVVPPAYGSYYAPPPAYYGPPGVSFGVTIH